MILTYSFAGSHEGHHHELTAEEKNQVTLKEINNAYLSSVKPIFQKSCFDCHSSTTHYPWYANLPLAKQLIASDLQEAKKHMDMSHDFPFQGHGSPLEDLKAIEESVSKGEMPPLRYRLMHLNKTVSAEDREAISDWVRQSLKSLGKASH